MSESAPLWHLSELNAALVQGGWQVWDMAVHQITFSLYPVTRSARPSCVCADGPLENHWFSEWRRRGLSSRGAEGSSGCLVNVDLLSCPKCALLATWQNAKLSKKWGERQTFDLISAKALVIISPKWGVLYASLCQGSLVLGDKVRQDIWTSQQIENSHSPNDMTISLTYSKSFCEAYF